MATSTRSLTVPTREAAVERQCACGCAPCEGTCCHLDCIVRPQFFCGQLLTDADLSALLKWARDRFGLSRYRHGWGVVCGLDVRCDPKRPAGILVTPGYAVNRCGSDILVCETASLDLTAACREETDPCADLRRRLEATKSRPVAVDAAGHEQLLGGGHTGQPGAAPEGGVEVKADRVVDIYLRYDEKPSEPTTALGRGSCRQVSECEYSRMRESYKLTYEFGVLGSDPVKARAVSWHEGYEKCLDVLKQFRAQFTNGFPLAEVRRWLVRWIDAHPQYRLCMIRDAICRAGEKLLTEERSLTKLLFELVVECRSAYLNCDCFGSDDDKGVPLARVWLAATDSGGNESCSIVAVDPYPPYRRPIQPECWPAPLGSVNVGRFIWHRWDEACPALRDLGLPVTHKEFTLPATLADLEKALQCDLFFKCDEQREALVYDTGLFGERVVGFCKTTGAPPPPPPPLKLDLEVTKSSNVTEATDGQSVSYTFEVRNSGDADLEVMLDDAQANFHQKVGTLRPGESRSSIQTVVVHANTADGLFRNEVVAQGFSNGQLVVKKSATHDVKILQPPPPPLCPTLSMDCPSFIIRGDSATFTVKISGGDPNVTPHINWTVSTGTISSGQGTPSITVDTTGVRADEKIITAIPEIVGFDPRCNLTGVSCTAFFKDPGPDCPTITVRCPATATVGGVILFTAEILGGNPAVTPTFNWTISAGTISSGQGTASIGVDTSGLQELPAVTATVEVGGFDPSCHTSASCTTNLRPDEVFDHAVGNRRNAVEPPPAGATVSPAVRDDLMEIDQIGTARAAKLNEAGIKMFADLASTPVEKLKELFPRVREEILTKWIKDAKKLKR